MYEKLKSWIKDDVIFLSLLLVMVGVGSFGLGRISVTPAVPKESSQGISRLAPLPATAAVAVENLPPDSDSIGEYVASKNSTKYHLSTCPGAKQIVEQNRLTFTSKQAAEAAGYTPAANCPGI